MRTPDALNQLLRQTHRRRRNVRILQQGLDASAIGMLVLQAAVLGDAILSPGPTGLAILDGGLILFGLLAMAYVGRSWFIARYQPSHIAQVIEKHLHLRGNVLINAVQLADQTDPHTSAALRQQAVAMGQKLASTIMPADTADWTAVQRAFGRWLVVLVFCALCYLMMPRVFHAVLPRLWSPTADDPPYTLVTFTIAVNPDPTWAHQPATIRATLTGPVLPTQATLVLTDPHQRVAMSRSREGGANDYTLPLTRVAHSRRFYIDTPQGRSGWQTLKVKPMPLLTQTHGAASPPSSRSLIQAISQDDRDQLQALKTQRQSLLQTLTDAAISPPMEPLQEALKNYANQAMKLSQAVSRGDLRTSLQAQADDARSLRDQLQRMGTRGQGSSPSSPTLDVLVEKWDRNVEPFDEDVLQDRWLLAGSSNTSRHANHTERDQHDAAAILYHVPLIYREAAEAYFRRIAEETSD